MRLRFVVPGPPVPKARARVVRDKETGKSHSFTPKATASYENAVKMCALSAWTRIRWDRESKAARYGLAVEVYRSEARGDFDNYMKSIADACNGVLWPDDRQIREAAVKIHECAKGQERAEVEVWVL